MTQEKLNNISETISEIANGYKGENTDEIEEFEKQEMQNKKIFIDELKNSLEGLENNILYEYLEGSEDFQYHIYKYMQQN